MCLPQAALALPPHSFVPLHARPPCILDIAPNTALHFTLASATPNYPTPRDTTARRSCARFPPPYALVARCLRPRLGPRLGPRYLRHARPIAAACALDLSARASVARRSCPPSPPHARPLLAAPAPPGPLIPASCAPNGRPPALSTCALVSRRSCTRSLLHARARWPLPLISAARTLSDVFAKDAIDAYYRCYPNAPRRIASAAFDSPSFQRRDRTICFIRRDTVFQGRGDVRGTPALPAFPAISPAIFPASAPASAPAIPPAFRPPVLVGTCYAIRPVIIASPSVGILILSSLRIPPLVSAPRAELNVALTI
ncbi:hypothetical protein B0H14DRAFT_3457923 [Mycena olivaceomarginata]|nr:hypothetical protein B0H14DRAFT_3457923 [Mycena olivaceomarginata]